MSKTTIHRFALKSGDLFKSNDAEHKWSPNIWEATLYKNKPVFPVTLVTDGKIVQVSLTFEELPYDVS